MSPAQLSLVILLITAVLMVFDKLPMTTIALVGALACCFAGLYEFKNIFSGLAGSTTVLLFGLGIIGTAMYKTGLAETIARFILKMTGKSERGVLVGITVVAAILSAFSSNTAVVLMMIPLVQSISRDTHVSLKKTMYALGIGAAAGGGCTLVGTTSSVAGNNVLESLGLPQMGFWTVGYIGIPFAICAVLYLYFVGYKQMPDEWVDIELQEGKDTQAEHSKRKMIVCAIISGATFVAMMISTSYLFVASLVGAVLMVLTGCIDEKSAYKSFDFKLMILIVSFGVISSSVSSSGGGDLIAEWFVNTVGTSANPVVIAAFLFLLCSLITHFMSNIVTVMLMGPIAFSIASGLGVNPYAMVMITIVACNCCYATPLGSPYFTMLMPIAHYSFKDYVKMGLPYVLINFVLALIIIPNIWAF
jgi:sodium-dependent dicarboxylate transporter 2/3/5